MCVSRMVTAFHPIPTRHVATASIFNSRVAITVAAAIMVKALQASDHARANTIHTARSAHSLPLWQCSPPRHRTQMSSLCWPRMSWSNACLLLCCPAPGESWPGLRLPSSEARSSTPLDRMHSFVPLQLSRRVSRGEAVRLQCPSHEKYPLIQRILHPQCLHTGGTSSRGRSDSDPDRTPRTSARWNPAPVKGRKRPWSNAVALDGTRGLHECVQGSIRGRGTSAWRHR